MELYQLRQFQAAARHKNMTRAASELCIAQPALSKTIHKLEEEFGAQLFIRNKKGLECTRQGEILLEYADRILALSEDAARAVSESLGDAGEIRLCLRSSAVLVSNVLKDFIHLLNGNNSQFVISSAMYLKILSMNTLMSAFQYLLNQKGVTC